MNIEAKVGQKEISDADSLGEITNILNFRLENLGLMSPGEKLDLKTLSIFDVSAQPQDIVMQEILKKVGLPDGFSIIYVNQHQLINQSDTVTLGGKEEKGLGKTPQDQCFLKISLKGLFDGVSEINLKFRRKDHTGPSVFTQDSDEIDGGFFQRKIPIGIVSKEKAEMVLLVAKNEDGVKTSFVSLPMGWKRVLENGKLRFEKLSLGINREPHGN